MSENCARSNYCLFGIQSIAEAFYGIPAVLIAECRSRIDEGLMTEVLEEFDRVLGRNGNAGSDDKKDD